MICLWIVYVDSGVIVYQWQVCGFNRQPSPRGAVEQTCQEATLRFFLNSGGAEPQTLHRYVTFAPGDHWRTSAEDLVIQAPNDPQEWQPATLPLRRKGGAGKSQADAISGHIGSVQLKRLLHRPTLHAFR